MWSTSSPVSYTTAPCGNVVTLRCGASRLNWSRDSADSNLLSRWPLVGECTAMSCPVGRVVLPQGKRTALPRNAPRMVFIEGWGRFVGPVPVLWVPPHRKTNNPHNAAATLRGSCDPQIRKLYLSDSR